MLEGIREHLPVDGVPFYAHIKEAVLPCNVGTLHAQVRVSLLIWIHLHGMTDMVVYAMRSTHWLQL
jgi:hypothetical protein